MVEVVKEVQVEVEEVEVEEKNDSSEDVELIVINGTNYYTPNVVNGEIYEYIILS